MSLDEFKNIFSTIYPSQLEQYIEPPDLNNEQHITIRMLDSLGHCEFDFESRKVYVCPPLLVTIPFIGLPKVILTGARDSNLVDTLRQGVKNVGGSARLIKLQQKGYPLLPEAIFIQSVNFEAIKEIADFSKILFQQSVAAWAIINYSSGIADVMDTSVFDKYRPLVNWKRRVFSTKYLRFISQSEEQNAVQLVEYTNSVTQQKQHWFWKCGRAARVDRDFGRYLALAHDGVNILVFDNLTYRLAVPEFVPLPRLFARALALCSGFAPIRAIVSSDNKFGLPPKLPVSVYRKVPIEVSKILSSKLSQKLSVQKIAINAKGEIL